MTIRRGWNNFFKEFCKIFAKALDKCNSIEYNEIELAMQVGGNPNFWLSFWRYGGNNKSATNKFMGDDLRQRRKGNGNKEKYKEGKY